MAHKKIWQLWLKNVKLSDSDDLTCSFCIMIVEYYVVDLYPNRWCPNGSRKATQAILRRFRCHCLIDQCSLFFRLIFTITEELSVVDKWDDNLITDIVHFGKEFDHMRIFLWATGGKRPLIHKHKKFLQQKPNLKHKGIISLPNYSFKYFHY